MTDTSRLTPLRGLTAVLGAAALALVTLAPAPSAASNDDLARILAGAAGAAILYGVLDSNRRAQAAQQRGGPPAHARPPAHVRPPAHANPGGRHVQPHHPPRAQPHQRHRTVALPSQCAIQVAGRGRGGSNVLFGQMCLRQAGFDIRRLPRQCAVELRTRNQRTIAYDGTCMQRAGFVVGRHGQPRWR